MAQKAAETLTDSAATFFNPKDALPLASESLNSAASLASSHPSTCFHCGTKSAVSLQSHTGKSFCCQGCLTVYELLTENGLDQFYSFEGPSGVRITSATPRQNQFLFLDAPDVRQRLIDFSDDRLTRVTFRIPAIHCIACVWLLENLFRLLPGVGQSQVNFLQKEVAISFHTSEVKLSEVVRLLTSLGYEPDLTLADLDRKPPSHAPTRRAWLQLGIAGFAFGNIMLLSLSSYLGLDTVSGPRFNQVFGYASLILALPVFFYSAGDYWQAAWQSFRQRALSIDVPIAVGILALFAQSTYEVFCGNGGGYFDSLCALLFFLLCGKRFQQKTFDRLSFDRDYKSFFPLSITRLRSGGEDRVSLSQLAVGDRLLLRNGELIPADAQLEQGRARIDYSFVTGESELVLKKPGDPLYAGGRQSGEAIVIQTTKPVSQSYLTSLWDQDAFRKQSNAFLTLTNRYSRRFTKIIFAVAVAAAFYWLLFDVHRAIKAFASVLIVACPCALALASPVGLGTAQRLLARRGIFLKNPHVLETLARVTAIVFDKTGTLTSAAADKVSFHGSPLNDDEQRWISALAHHSTHPLPTQIRQSIPAASTPCLASAFLEQPGLGIQGIIDGHRIRMGSMDFIGSSTALSSAPLTMPASAVHVSIDRQYRGCYAVARPLRPGIKPLLDQLSRSYQLDLLSGDNDKQRAELASIFPPSARLHFHQCPADKLAFIRQLQNQNSVVMMVGDGLNDAGALQQSDAGISVAENLSAFTPASDVILSAAAIPEIHRLLRFAKSAVRIVKASFFVSSIYNLAGLSIAARGWLSPVICAVLMPLSSITVVAFACSATRWAGRRLAIDKPA